MLRLRGLVERPDIAIVHRFRPPPYGGSNQFLTALRNELRARGLRVSSGALARRTRACLLHSYLVDAEEVHGALPPGCRVVHRVDGPIALYRGSDHGEDRRIVAINRELADATIFQSRYSLDAHRQLGLDLREPVVIPNAVDPRIFSPPPSRDPLDGRPLRVVATSWSDNPRKGGATYAWLARNLDPARFEFTFVGRSAVPIEGGRTLPPLPSRELADVLRASDVFITASRNEPCSNALLEALACELPALYLRSGSHEELVGEAGLGFDDDEAIPDLLEQLAAEVEERRAKIAVPSLADVTDRYLETLGLP